MNHNSPQGNSKRKYRLIALDIDGTLLNDDYEITPLTLQTVREAHEDGALIVLCTGRGPANTLPIMQFLGVDGLMVTHNGAVHLNATGEIIQENVFTLEEVQTLIDDCREEQVHVDLNTAYDLFIETTTELADEMYVNFKVEPIQVKSFNDVKGPFVKLCLFGEEADLDRMQARWATKDWHALKHIHMIRSGEDFIDVMDVDASKGRALLQLAAKFGFAREEILAIGNYYNDIDMLRTAGFAVAMGNSPDPVKAVAHWVTADNNGDGVHYALQKHYFGRDIPEIQPSAAKKFTALPQKNQTTATITE